MEPHFDLFGHPVREGFGNRGRPPYEPTERDRNKIKLLLALGWSNQRIANGVGISLATMKRYFRAELKVRDAMRDRLDARRYEIALEQANAGNVTALRELGAMIDRNDRMTIEASMGKGRDDEQPTVSKDKVGKKMIDEQRAHAADEDLMAELESEAAAQNARH
ncbi:AraC family transcriptional regulator [Mesorhizobium sp. B2-1-3A]|uniref:AraC family transcriptional regulator n=1 Tax=Mesorhizobium sp. B2-1-3A TaxID=2589971 RepID=UPI00112D5C7E|nr:AraC family transcriptional regulator [Mesorhizobium sp. B2-1-3A]TPM92717.1 AraC family transcriptional regulator [Mesorhizobium sp. B2-1-3A]